jgi:hypothetical protein
VVAEAIGDPTVHAMAAAIAIAAIRDLARAGADVGLGWLNMTRLLGLSGSCGPEDPSRLGLGTALGVGG